MLHSKFTIKNSNSLKLYKSKLFSYSVYNIYFFIFLLKGLLLSIKCMNTVNVTYLEEVCGDSKEIIKEMVDIFIEQIPGFCSEMHSLYNDEKYHDLGLLAHKAKSSVAIMGMESLAVQLKEFELIAKSGEKTEQYSTYIDKFCTETDKAIKELKDYINKM